MEEAIQELLDHLKEQRRMFLEMGAKMDYFGNEQGARIKNAGYSQAIIDVEEWWRDRPKG